MDIYFQSVFKKSNSVSIIEGMFEVHGEILGIVFSVYNFRRMTIRQKHN